MATPQSNADIARHLDPTGGKSPMWGGANYGNTPAPQQPMKNNSIAWTGKPETPQVYPQKAQQSALPKPQDFNQTLQANRQQAQANWYQNAQQKVAQSPQAAPTTQPPQQATSSLANLVNGIPSAAVAATASKAVPGGGSVAAPALQTALQGANTGLEAAQYAQSAAGTAQDARFANTARQAAGQAPSLAQKAGTVLKSAGRNFNPLAGKGLALATAGGLVRTGARLAGDQGAEDVIDNSVVYAGQQEPLNPWQFAAATGLSALRDAGDAATFGGAGSLGSYLGGKIYDWTN